MDNFDLLEPTQHMFEMIAKLSFQDIRNQVEKILKDQVEDSILEKFVVTSEPNWLTGAIKSDEDHVIVVRAGVAFEFNLIVWSENIRHQLVGVFTWVGYQLNDVQNANSKTWFDIDGTLAEFGKDGLLAERIYLK